MHSARTKCIAIIQDVITRENVFFFSSIRMNEMNMLKAINNGMLKLIIWQTLSKPKRRNNYLYIVVGRHSRVINTIQNHMRNIYGDVGSHV